MVHCNSVRGGPSLQSIDSVGWVIPVALIVPGDSL